ncbi:hypothetical protein BGZ75_008683 [Mortierella antarctica]|nr:hypothetical protein BGZ75_008683 [Mortierella antarctica]
MTPEELAALFKRRGDFDSTRKNLLSDFQNSSVGQQFTTQLGDILQGCIDEDPSLLQREKSDFHQAMVERITKSSEYKKVQQFVDSLLQPTQYMSKIENTLMTIVKEHAPPPTEKDTAQDDDKVKGHRNAKGHASTSSKQSKDNQAEDGSKENNSSIALASSSGSTTMSATSATKASSTKKEDSIEPHRPNGGSERRTKDISSSKAKVKKELNLGLPPRPQLKVKERHQGHATSVAPLVKKESSSSDLQPSIEPSAERPRKHSNHPRKRNRRQHSVDSNSSLSSPPSSSEVDSDGDGKEKGGSRARKLARADNTSKASTRPETDVSKAKDLHASDATELMEGVETAAEVIPEGDDQDTKISDEHPVQSDTAKLEDTTKDDAMNVDPAVTEAGDSMKEVSVSTATEIDHGDVVQEEKTSMHGKESNKDFAPDAASSDKTPATPTAPVSTITRSGASSSSSSSSNPSSVNNSPAVMGAGANRRRESDAMDRRASPSHHGSSHSKRTGHLPLPLPPRPSLSLPPKPTTPSSSSRKASHVRNSSSITSGTGPASIKGTSSSTSTSASVPPLSSSSSGSRQPSISGSGGGTGGSSGSTRDRTPSDRADSRSSGQGHLHHPLPPPPHLHHPLPPTPRSGHSGSRSQSFSGVAKSATSSTSVSSSKPLISTSQTLIGTGSSSDNSALTTSTPKSATSLTSPAEPRTEDRETGGSGRVNSEIPSTAPVSKGDHSLKSPKSNSSSGSISSTGSLSTTGSTTNLTALSSPDTGTKEAAPTSELSKDRVASVPDSAQSPKPVELSATAKVQESTAKIGEALLGNDSTLASQSEAIEYPPTVPPPPPTSSPPPSAPSPPPPSPPPPPPPPPPEPPVASPTPSTPTPTPTPPARPPLSKQEKSQPSASPPSSSSSKPKSHGRTPIPLPSKPHKPIPLPQRPSAPASGGGLGSLKKKQKAALMELFRIQIDDESSHSTFTRDERLILDDNVIDSIVSAVEKGDADDALLEKFVVPKWDIYWADATLEPMFLESLSTCLGPTCKRTKSIMDYLLCEIQCYTDIIPSCSVVEQILDNVLYSGKKIRKDTMTNRISEEDLRLIVYHVMTACDLSNPSYKLWHASRPVTGNHRPFNPISYPGYFAATNLKDMLLVTLNICRVVEESPKSTAIFEFDDLTGRYDIDFISLSELVEHNKFVVTVSRRNDRFFRYESGVIHLRPLTLYDIQLLKYLSKYFECDLSRSVYQVLSAMVLSDKDVDLARCIGWFSDIPLDAFGDSSQKPYLLEKKVCEMDTFVMVTQVVKDRKSFFKNLVRDFRFQSSTAPAQLWIALFSFVFAMVSVVQFIMELSSAE